MHTTARRRADLVVAVELDLHGPVLELDAVEALDRSLGLLTSLEKHGTPALGAAGVGVADGLSLDHVANLLEHLAEILGGGGPGKVAHNDLKAGGSLGAAGVGAAGGLVSTAGALEANDDGAALELRVVELSNGVVGGVGGFVVDETPTLGAATGLTGNLSLNDSAHGGAVGCKTRTRGRRKKKKREKKRKKKKGSSSVNQPLTSSYKYGPYCNMEGRILLLLFDERIFAKFLQAFFGHHRPTRN